MDSLFSEDEPGSWPGDRSDNVVHLCAFIDACVAVSQVNGPEVEKHLSTMNLDQILDSGMEVLYMVLDPHIRNETRAIELLHDVATSLRIEALHCRDLNNAERLYEGLRGVARMLDNTYFVDGTPCFDGEVQIDIISLGFSLAMAVFAAAENMNGVGSSVPTVLEIRDRVLLDADPT